MTIETAIFTRLTGHAGTTALVGTRVYPDHLPQNPTYPAITYTRVTTERASAMGVDTGVVEAEFRIVCFDETYAEVKAVALQVLDALQRFRGTVDSVVIQDVFIINQDYDFDDDVGLYEINLDFSFWHRE